MRGVADEEGVFSVRDGRGSVAGHFLEQMWTREVPFCSQIVIWFLFGEGGTAEAGSFSVLIFF